MAFLVIKYDGDYNTHRAKSHIVVLDNHEDRTFNNYQPFAPVLSYYSLRTRTSKAIEKMRILQQGDFKNTFYNALPPEVEITIVFPPLGNSDSSPDDFWLLRKSLYGLRQLPQHW